MHLQFMTKQKPERNFYENVGRAISRNISCNSLTWSRGPLSTRNTISGEITMTTWQHNLSNPTALFISLLIAACVRPYKLYKNSCYSQTGLWRIKVNPFRLRYNDCAMHFIYVWVYLHLKVIRWLILHWPTWLMYIKHEGHMYETGKLEDKCTFPRVKELFEKDLVILLWDTGTKWLT